MITFLAAMMAAALASAKITWGVQDYEDLVKRVNSQPGGTWKAKLVPGFDYNHGPSLVAKLAGKNSQTPKSPDGVQPAFQTAARVLQNLPESYDLRKAFPNCTSISMIRDQGGCGGCYALSAANSLSDRHCIKSVNDGKFEERFYSAEDIVECCDSAVCKNSAASGCFGGDVAGPFAHARDVGVVTGEAINDFTKCKPWHFNPGVLIPVPTCNKTCTIRTNSTSNSTAVLNASATAYASDLRKIKGFTVYTASNGSASIATAMQNVIRSGGSVSAYMTVYFDFFGYSGGVYKHTTNDVAGSHVVRLIGWGVDNGVKYWIGANCWGSKWGNEGFFWIERGTNESLIESYVVEATL